MLFFEGIEACETAEPCDCSAWCWRSGRVTHWRAHIARLYSNSYSSCLASCGDPVPSSFWMRSGKRNASKGSVVQGKRRKCCFRMRTPDFFLTDSLIDKSNLET